MKKIIWTAFTTVLVASTAWSQQLSDFDVLESELQVEGWQGFTDFEFLGSAFLTLTLAAVLGAIIAYHPRYTRSADTFEELEAPKIYIMYAVIGALIGIMVVKYGLDHRICAFWHRRADTLPHGTSFGAPDRQRYPGDTDRPVERPGIAAYCGIGDSLSASCWSMCSMPALPIASISEHYREELVAEAAAAYRSILERARLPHLEREEEPSERAGFRSSSAPPPVFPAVIWRNYWNQTSTNR